MKPFKYFQTPKAPKTMNSPHKQDGGIRMEHLGKNQCKFPVSGHLDYHHTFCGKPSEKTYCEHHQKICYKEKENENQS